MNEMTEVREAFPKDALGRERIWAKMEARDVVTDEGGLRMGGTAAVFGARAKVRLKDGRVAVEEVAQSAFNNTLKRGDIYLLWQHNPAEPMARTGAGSLDLSVRTDGKLPGLDWQAQGMPDTQRVRDAAALMSAGVIDKVSFGFTVPDGGDSLTRSEDGTLLRTLHDVRLAEISLVTWPAYQETSASLRSDAFGILCRQLGVDENEILSRLSDDELFDLATLTATPLTRSGAPGAVTTSGDATGAATTLHAGINTRLARAARLRATSLEVLHELPAATAGREAGSGVRAG